MYQYICENYRNMYIKPHNGRRGGYFKEWGVRKLCLLALW